MIARVRSRPMIERLPTAWRCAAAAYPSAAPREPIASWSEASAASTCQVGAGRGRGLVAGAAGQDVDALLELAHRVGRPGRGHQRARQDQVARGDRVEVAAGDRAAQALAGELVGGRAVRRLGGAPGEPLAREPRRAVGRRGPAPRPRLERAGPGRHRHGPLPAARRPERGRRLAQGARERRGVREAGLGRLGERLQDDPLELDRDVEVRAAERGRHDGLVAVPGHDLVGVAARERGLAGHQLVQQHAGRVDVGRDAGAAAGDQLRRHVLRRAGHEPARAQAALRGIAAGPGQPEVDHLHQLGAVVQLLDQHVVALHVAVDDPRAVGLVEGAQDLADQLRGPADRERAGCLHQAGEAGAAHVLHHQERGAAVGLAEVDHRDDVGVVQTARGAGLVVEPARDPRIGGERGVQDLDRDRPVERGLVGGEHHPHAAVADPGAQDVLAREHVADPDRPRARTLREDHTPAVRKPRAGWSRAPARTGAPRERRRGGPRPGHGCRVVGSVRYQRGAEFPRRAPCATESSARGARRVRTMGGAKRAPAHGGGPPEFSRASGGGSLPDRRIDAISCLR